MDTINISKIVLKKILRSSVDGSSDILALGEPILIKENNSRFTFKIGNGIDKVKDLPNINSSGNGSAVLPLFVISSGSSVELDSQKYTCWYDNDNPNNLTVTLKEFVPEDPESGITYIPRYIGEFLFGNDVQHIITFTDIPNCYGISNDPDILFTRDTTNNKLKAVITGKKCIQFSVQNGVVNLVNKELVSPIKIFYGPESEATWSPKENDLWMSDGNDLEITPNPQQDPTENLTRIQIGTKIYKIKADSTNVQVDWNIDDPTSAAYIKNKPDLTTFEKTDNRAQTIPGALNDSMYPTVGAIKSYVVQSDWNITDASKMSYIKNKPEVEVTGNKKQTISNTGTTSDYYPSVQAILDYHDSTKEDVSNKVTSDTGSISGSSTDDQYPSAKVVYNYHDVTKQDISKLTTTITSTSSDSQYPSAKAVYTITNDINTTINTVKNTTLTIKDSDGITLKEYKPNGTDVDLQLTKTAVGLGGVENYTTAHTISASEHSDSKYVTASAVYNFVNDQGYVKKTGDTMSGSLVTTSFIQAAYFNATSDQRLKENIRQYIPTHCILDLPVYQYDFINGAKDQIGCLAQELKVICPEIVHTNEDGYLSIQESKIVYLLLEEVKKLEKRVAELENKR